MSAANQLLTALTTMIDPNAAVPRWIAAPQQAPVLNHQAARWGRHQDTGRMKEVERVLDELAEQSAVPGHEGPIRNILYQALPAWAREIAQSDEMGNLWVEFGPQGSGGDATVFIAHMDEVGWQVESIEADGVVNLTRLGGVVTTAWEGQPALLQLDPNTDIDSLPSAPQMRGVFLVRDSFSQNNVSQENGSEDGVEQKRPASVRAWFGMNAEQLIAAGVQVGMGITGYKEGHRMGEYRYASRSLDDRVGTTALLMALSRIDRSRLSNPVIFAWSVREEGGLRGATRLAEYYGRRARRVYSIDTFVSSDTPLESPHFAYAPLGAGPVLRSIENAGMATPYELDRNKRVASDAGIEVQVGLTQGSTDGTGFTPYGAPNSGLSWPGRYSHSPAEIADLRDVVKLIDLIQAMAEAPSGSN